MKLQTVDAEGMCEIARRYTNADHGGEATRVRVTLDDHPTLRPAQLTVVEGRLEQVSRPHARRPFMVVNGHHIPAAEIVPLERA